MHRSHRETRAPGRPCAVLAAGLALLAALAPPAASAHLGEASCSGLSPVSNACLALPFRIGKHAQPFVAALGPFVGQLEIGLKELGGDDEVEWSCNVLADPALPLVSGCGPPEGKLPADHWVWLECKARVYRLLGQSVAGPLGSWTCGVRY